MDVRAKDSGISGIVMIPLRSRAIRRSFKFLVGANEIRVRSPHKLSLIQATGDGECRAETLKRVPSWGLEEHLSLRSLIHHFGTELLPSPPEIRRARSLDEDRFSGHDDDLPLPGDLRSLRHRKDFEHAPGTARHRRAQESGAVHVRLFIQ